MQGFVFTDGNVVNFFIKKYILALYLKSDFTLKDFICS